MKTLFLTASLMLVAFTPALAQSTNSAMPSNPNHMRQNHHSDRNLKRVSRVIERLINQLQKDNHDYAGHRVTAISDLQAARNEINAAEMADKGH